MLNVAAPPPRVRTSAADREGRPRAVGERFKVVVVKLKTRFIDRSGVDYGSLGDLKRLRGGCIVEAALRQIKSPDSDVAEHVVVKAVARDEGVSRIDGVINARTEIRESPRDQHALPNLHGVESRIENCCSYQIVVVRIVTICLEKER